MRARDNPFASRRIEGLSYRFLDGSWEELLARFAALGGRGALVGPEGSGKTTLLEQLAARLTAAGREVGLVGAEPERGPRRDRLQRLLRAAGPSTLLLVDGADALAAGEWRSLARETRALGGLVVTAHREGLLPTLHRTTTSAALLAELATSLAGEHSGPPEDWEALHRRHGGDVRAALRALYDSAATDRLLRRDGVSGAG